MQAMTTVLLLSVETVTKDIPEIIKAASASPLGILALLILAIAGIAFVFFRKQGPKVTMPVFAAILVAGTCYGFAVTRVPKPPITRITGKVVDVETDRPLADATVHLDWGTSHDEQTSDSEGYYLFVIEGAGAPEIVRVAVEAE